MPDPLRRTVHAVPPTGEWQQSAQRHLLAHQVGPPTRFPAAALPMIP